MDNRRDICVKDMLNELKEKIFSLEQSIYNNLNLFFENKPKFILFISYCDGQSRAYVSKGSGNSLETGWKNAVDLMNKRIKELKLNPVWIKADVVTEIKQYSFDSFLDYVSKIKTNYFREGISFDRWFNLAFLEQEVNSNAFIRGKKDSPEKEINWGNVKFYVKRNLGKTYKVEDDLPANIYTFKTIGFFHDGSQCCKLNYEWLNNGRRQIKSIDIPLLSFIIEKSSKFLSRQVYDNGKFRYGYFPCFDKEIDFYNILRHASTTYSMIEAYEVTKDAELANAIKAALGYLLNQGIEFVKDSEGKTRAFVVERVSGNEIKLGANAAALLAFSKYSKVFGDLQYLEVMEQLAEGICYFQDEEEGSFVHVLNFPDLSTKEKHRIIYYDGEAAFALMRFYELDKKQRWLDTVVKAFEYFIENKYWRHNDHWLSYCSNELFKHKPEKKYVQFNLQNAGGILDFCLKRETTYPTLLELLMATFSMIEKIKSEKCFLETLDSFGEKKFTTAVLHRVEHQLNGLFFPEVAMYFKAPQNILWAFYIRHHSFRVRIDDIEHNISGYCSYLSVLRRGGEILFPPEL